jgi:hypothetical protein
MPDGSYIGFGGKDRRLNHAFPYGMGGFWSRPPEEDSRLFVKQVKNKVEASLRT